MSELPTFTKGDRVKYVRGVKSTLIGKVGTVEGLEPRDDRLVWVRFPGLDTYQCYRGNLEKQRYCFLCNSMPAEEALCENCREDIMLLGLIPPAEDATKEQVDAWVKRNQMTVTTCGEEKMGPGSIL